MLEYDIEELGGGAPTALAAATEQLGIDGESQDPILVIERPDFQRLGIIADGELVAYADSLLAQDGTWVIVENGRCT